MQLHQQNGLLTRDTSSPEVMFDNIPAHEKGDKAQYNEIKCLQIRDIFQHSASPSYRRRVGLREAAKEGRFVMLTRLPRAKLESNQFRPSLFACRNYFQALSQKQE